MTSHSWRSLAFAIAGSGLAFLGCADDGVSLHVLCSANPTVEDGICAFEAQGEDCVARGVLNLEATAVYTLDVRVESGLRARKSVAPPRGESNAMYIQSANVELRRLSGERLDLFDAAGNLLPNPYTVQTSAYVAPQGVGVVALHVIDEVRGASLYRELTAGRLPAGTRIMVAVKLDGKTVGSVRVSSDEFAWPIELISSPASECLPTDYCLERWGQDNYAQACL